MDKGTEGWTTVGQGNEGLDEGWTRGRGTVDWDWMRGTEGQERGGGLDKDWTRELETE